MDFARDETGPLGGLPDVLCTSVGPAPDGGTVWNDYSIALDGVDSTIPTGYSVSNLLDSSGAATAIGVTMSSGWYRVFNGTPANALLKEWAFARNSTGIVTVSGLDPLATYDIHLIGSGGYPTDFMIGGTTKAVTGAFAESNIALWTENNQYVVFSGLSPDGGGIISISVEAHGSGSDGALAAMQISTSGPAPHVVNFLYPDAVASTGGQFGDSYAPANLMNDGFTSPSNTISTTSDYLAAGHNYATASGTTGDFDITFDFSVPTAVDGLHVWNYAYRNGTSGAASTNAGVNAYTLTFYSAPGGTGSAIGGAYAGNLAAVPWNADNPAESVYFDTAYEGVRSVVMHVLSNHGGTAFAGMNELAFNGVPSVMTPYIDAFTGSVAFAQSPEPLFLEWSVVGEAASLSIAPGIGDVLSLTTNGAGRIQVAPLGEQTYTLTLNGTVQQTVSVVGLPTKEKLHLYLLIGQSNMQGAGAPYSATLDAPHPRVVKFGSRNLMEPVFVKGSHNLTLLGTSNSGIGMGIEFGKTMLASQSDPDVVIGLINHALGSTAIQWWAPGVPNNKWVNPATGEDYYLYDEAVQRVNDARQYGVLKGVLWHQGEYNCGTQTNPDSDPDGYAARLQALVDNLRGSFGNPALPFVCGKFVPASWVDAGGTTNYFTGLTYRATVEGAMVDLPNHRNNTFCVDNNGLRGRADQLIHFDSYSQRLLGQRYAAAMAGFYADPYRLYLGGFLTPAEMADALRTDPAGDIDGDGRENFIEYACLSDPTATDAGPLMALTAGNFPAVSYLQRTDTEAPEYVVEISSNLAAWAWNTEGQLPVTEEVGLPVDQGNGSAIVTVRPLEPTPSGFFRLRVDAQ